MGQKTKIEFKCKGDYSRFCPSDCPLYNNSGLLSNICCDRIKGDIIKIEIENKKEKKNGKQNRKG